MVAAVAVIIRSQEKPEITQVAKGAPKNSSAIRGAHLLTVPFEAVPFVAPIYWLPFVAPIYWLPFEAPIYWLPIYWLPFEAPIYW